MNDICGVNMNIGSYFFPESSQSLMQSAFSILEKNTSRTNLFFGKYLPHQPFSEEPKIGKIAYGEKDISANTSSVVRQLGSSTPSMSALGMTTCWNLPQGLMGINGAKKSYLQAEEVHDVAGKTLSASDFVSRCGQVLGGAGYCFIRLDDIINNGFSGDMTSLSKANSYATPIAAYGFGALYASLLPISGICLSEIYGFLDRIQSARAQGSQESRRRFIGELVGVFPDSMPSKDFYEGLGKELRHIVGASQSFSDESLGRSLFARNASFSSLRQSLWYPGDHSKYLPQVLKSLSISLTSELKAHDLKKNEDLITALWSRKLLKQEDVYIYLGLKLKELFSEINPKLVKNLSHKELGKALFTQEYQKFLPILLDRLAISSKDVKRVEDLQSHPHLIRAIWGREKEAIHGRVFGSRGMKAIAKARDLQLYDLLNSTNDMDRLYAEKQSEILLKELETGAKENRLMFSLYLLTGILGTAFTGIADSAYNTIGFFCCFAFMWAADFINFRKSLESEGSPGTWDRLYVMLHLFLGACSVTVSSLLLSGTFVAANFGTGGLFFPVAILSIASVWMGMDIWALFEIDRRKAKYRENHPKLEHFLEKVSSKASFEDKAEMFHKLPQLMQKQILLSGLEKTGAGKHLYASLDVGPIVTKESLGKAVSKTQDLVLASDTDPITEENALKHPLKQVFMKNLCREWVLDGQKKILRRIDRVEGRLRSAVESVLQKTKIPVSSQKTLSAT